MAKVEIEYTRIRTVTFYESGTVEADVPKHVLEGGHISGWLVRNYEKNREFTKRVDAAAESSEEVQTIDWDSVQVI